MRLTGLTPFRRGSCPGDSCEKGRILQRLQQIGDDTSRFTALAYVGVMMRADDDGRDLNALKRQALEQLKAAHPRHLQINYQTLRQNHQEALQGMLAPIGMSSRESRVSL